MEIQTITLEHWMCRICLGKGAHNIFDERLSLAPEDEHHQGQPSSTRHHSSSDPISIIDALNCFCEFKVRIRFLFREWDWRWIMLSL